MSQSRLSGIVISSFGLLLLFVVIPYETENVDYGWMRPQTLPNILAGILVASGLAISLAKDKEENLDAFQSAKSLAYLAIMAAGLFLTNLLGFAIVSPVLAFTLMWVIGERRIRWLATGVIGVPLFIWVIVVIVLGRILP